MAIREREVPVTTPLQLQQVPNGAALAAFLGAGIGAFAMGLSTRQIEDLLRVILAEEGPDHSTIGRWVADAAAKAKGVLAPLDAACIPRARTLALDEIFFGGDRPWSPSSRRA